MTNTKEIIKQGIKPVLHFTCKMCSTEWLDSEYKIKERNSTSIIYDKQPVSDCPICNMTSYNYKKLQEKLVTKNIPEPPQPPKPIKPELRNEGFFINVLTTGR